MPPSNWKQDDETVTVEITVPPPASLADLNIECTDAYVKINCPPFLEIVDLYGDVDEQASAATIKDRTVTFRLVKQTKGEWPALNAAGSKAELMQRRQQAAVASQQREQERREQVKKIKEKATDVSFHTQWDIDKEHRREIEERKAEEKQKAAEDLDAWSEQTENKQQQQQQQKPLKPGQDEDDEYEEDEEDEEEIDPVKREEKKKQRAITRAEEKARSTYRQLRESGATTASDAMKTVSPAPITIVNAPLPPPRSAAKIEISFTPKPTHLPARERIEEDEDSLKDSGAPAHAMASASEQSAAWLKERADGFFRQRNYAAAINAYSSALRLDVTHVGAMIGRGASLAQDGRFALAVTDATSALNLLEKKRQKDNVDVESDVVTQRGMCRTLAHRAVAHIRLGMFKEAIKDYEAALRLNPLDDTMSADLQRLVTAVNNSKYVELKRIGDDKFLAGDHEGALSAYEAAIEIDGGCWQALSNASACCLSLSHPPQAFDFADRALKALGDWGGEHFSLSNSNNNNNNNNNNNGGKDGGKIVSMLAFRPLVRRGVAACEIGNFDQGREDLQTALRLEPANAQLRHDVSLLVSSSSMSSPQMEMMREMLGLPSN